MVRGKEGRTGLHAIALNGPSVISATSSSPRGSPLSNAASTKELASYDSASTSALADARLRSPFIVSSGICLLGTTRRCVPPRSVAPSTTSRCSQPSTQLPYWRSGTKNGGAKVGLRELENWLGGVTVDARAGKSRV